MADIEDVNDGLEMGELETVENQQIEEPKQAVSDLPEKYRGKSVSDVVKMHQEAEKLVGRTMNEVNEVRKLADELIKSQLTPKPKVEEVRPVDFFENPQEAIRQQIENNPRVLAAEQYARQTQAVQNKQILAQMHPDVTNVVADPEFKSWVAASKVRQKLFADADNYDLDAANELLSTYKELRSVRQQKVTEVDNTARSETLRAASVDTGGSGESTKKVYRRADLIRLKMRDPNKYASMQDEIMDAYSQGRVK
jgi:hypothetical protein